MLISGLALCGSGSISPPPLDPPAPIIITTEDQAQVHLYRYPGKGKTGSPAVLLPEIGTSHLIFDLPASGGLAPFLSGKGREVWVVRFRGAGPGSRGSSLDELLRYDLPRALARVQEETPGEKLDLIGLGLGGTLLLEYLSSSTEAVSGIGKIVLINAPGSMQSANQAVKIWADKTRGLKAEDQNGLIDLKKSCQAPAPWPTIPGSLFHLLFWGPVAEEKTEGNICQSVFEPIPSALAKQLARWVETGILSSRDGKSNYLINLKNIRTPALFLSGQLDNLFPPWQADYAYRSISSEKKKIRIFGRANRYTKEYGHFDLILGQDAFREVYPYLLDWLEKP